MEATSAWIRGDRSKRNWKESWPVSVVDGTAWTRLQEDLRRRYAELQQTIEAHALNGEDACGGALGAIAHIAYHLGSDPAEDRPDPSVLTGAAVRPLRRKGRHRTNQLQHSPHDQQRTNWSGHATTPGHSALGGH